MLVQEEDKAARVSSLGSHYRGLLKQRQRMEILLNDYYVQKDASTFAQVLRGTYTHIFIHSHIYMYTQVYIYV